MGGLHDEGGEGGDHSGVDALNFTSEEESAAWARRIRQDDAEIGDAWAGEPLAQLDPDGLLASPSPHQAYPPSHSAQPLRMDMRLF
mmetsp:Transcript_5289/g.13999  ORF Transcript_5289/g.13999 Transcript_5289/m.13999 type:complete len:86 (+) Transcript_5289:2-259(+)